MGNQVPVTSPKFYLTIKINKPDPIIIESGLLAISTVIYYNPQVETFKDLNLRCMVEEINHITNNTPWVKLYNYGDDTNVIEYKNNECNYCGKLKKVFKEYEQKSGMKITCNEKKTT